MSHFNISTKINRSNFKTKTHTAKQNYLPSDDVHRIAMRSPDLYKINAVPSFATRGLSLYEDGGMT